ncbi:hypothetical protein LWI29_034613 [Acer saccharum]|uniref:Uncharacterized protein n=1 Tax=Acer saccharum TaxID=4024 RepID=A0AA39VW63_ACESA|nr:hypothetical protein LWI29_034613 [Acer saccharum]
MESIHLFQFSKTKANLSEEIIFQFYITRIHEGSELHFLDWEVLGKIKINKGYTESLADDIELEVPDDDYGLYAIDILDPSVVKTIFFAMLCMLMV